MCTHKIPFLIITRNVTVCNKCPRRSLIMTLIPGCDLEHSRGTSLAQDVTCHFVLLFCVTLTLGKEFDYDISPHYCLPFHEV